MPRVTFLPWNRTAEVPAGTTVFDAARAIGVPIPTACVGQASCGLCRVKVVAGEAALPPIGPRETRHLGNTYFLTRLRLSCQAPVSGDVVVQVPGARVP